MRSQLVHNKIALLGSVIDDIRALEVHMQYVADPALLIEYKVDMAALILELDSVSERCVTLLEAYVEDCRDAGIPVLLDYFRVLKELQRVKGVL